MRILWCSVNPRFQASFGIVSHELLKRLRGHEICFAAQWYYGEPTETPEGYTLVSSFNERHLAYYAQKLKPDVTLIYQSPPLLQKISDTIIKDIKKHSRKLFLYVPIEGFPLTCNIENIFNSADLILVPSRFSQECLRKEGWNSKVLYHGVDPFFKPRRSLTQKYANPNPFICGTIASHVVRKQLTRIADAYKIVHDQGYNAQFLMCATTYDYVAWDADLKKYVAKLNAKIELSQTAYLNLAITKEAIQRQYNMCHLHVLPSSESFGLPNLEAMACGCVPLVVNHGGSPEVVGDCGIYVEPKDFLTLEIGNIALVDRQALAEKIVWAIENSLTLQRLAIKGVERAKKFSWESSTQTLLYHLGKLAL